MQITIREVGRVLVLELTGKITLGEGGEDLKDAVNCLISEGKVRLILNMKDVPYVDNAGLGEIVRSYTTAVSNCGMIKLLNPSKRITDLLSITKLLTVFEIFDDETDAIKSFE